MSTLSPLDLPPGLAATAEEMAAGIRAQRAIGDVLIFVDLVDRSVWMKRRQSLGKQDLSEAPFVQWLAEVACVDDQAVAIFIIDERRHMRCSVLLGEPSDDEAARLGRTLLGRFMPSGGEA